jgi:hypothetical protein
MRSRLLGRPLRRVNDPTTSCPVRNWSLTRPDREPPWRFELQTYALRDSPDANGCCWLPLAEAVYALRAHW